MGTRKPARQDLLPGTLDMLILKTLATGGVLHGYGVAEHIRLVSEDVLRVEEGSLVRRSFHILQILHVMTRAVALGVRPLRVQIS